MILYTQEEIDALDLSSLSPKKQRIVRQMLGTDWDDQSPFAWTLEGKWTWWQWRMIEGFGRETTRKLESLGLVAPSKHIGPFGLSCRGYHLLRLLNIPHKVEPVRQAFADGLIGVGGCYGAGHKIVEELQRWTTLPAVATTYTDAEVLEVEESQRICRRQIRMEEETLP